MYPFRRILVPTDFSTASEWAFEEAAKLAADCDAELIILHVRLTWSDRPERLRLPADASLYEYAEKQEFARLRDRASRLHGNVRMRLVVAQAPESAKAICEAATREEADLVTIATHARHHVAHLIIGSTTMAVIAHPPAPVLAIRYGTKKRDRIRRVVVPVHPEQTSRAAFELGAAVARHTHAQLHLLTVCSQPDRKAAEEHLHALAAECADTAVTEAILFADDIEREVVRYTEKVNADAILLNSGDQFSELKAGIVRHASTPVLIVP